MSTHPLLDYMNTYGVRPFLPFDGSWFYGDTLFVIDPLFDFALASALATGHLVKNYRRHFAIAGLVLVTLYIGARTELRNLSQSFLSDFDKAAVSPAALNPFRWTGLIDSAVHVSVVAIDPFKGLVGEPYRIPKSPPDSIIRKAAETRSGNAFFGFARFPVARVRENESGYSVLFLDVRYYNDSSRTGFAAKILLDSSLLVIDESLGFNQSVD
jgi:inner membrane protein